MGSVRQYIVFDAEKLLDRPVPQSLELDEAECALKAALGSDLQFAVESLPTARFMPNQDMKHDFIPEGVAAIVSPDEPSARAVNDAVVRLTDREGEVRISGIGANPTIAISDYSFPGSVEVGLMCTRKEAHHLAGIDAIPPAFNLNGDSINVVVVDSGLDATLVPGQWGGGWQPLPSGPVPGTTTGDYALHGMMIVRNILAVAPQARIWDVPLIPPPRINDIGKFVASAQATFGVMLKDIQLIQQSSAVPQQWVFVNAWGIFDRRSEFPFRDYTENRPGSPLPNIFIKKIEELAFNNFDIVFCAGNCGGVCPDGRCGPNDYGPGRGIWGANAHHKVLTVGATRIDCTWIGYSSEGPAPAIKLAREKPDLCAPSEYLESGGDYPPNVGTSAAAALAGGVVAAFRSRWSQTAVPPAALNGVLMATARKINGAVWTPRIGNGILNAAAAAAALP